MSKQYANEFLNYVNASPSPYHAVQTSKKLLVAGGFTEISERQPWSSQIQAGKKYFLTRNGSSLIAFGVGKKWQPGNGISIVGAHTDSPTFRVKPNSKKSASGYHQVGVEVYGGGLWHTWFDRDLSVAGRVYVHDKASGRYLPKLVKIEKPILRIPTLAIHLDRTVNTKLEINKETQLYPILGLIEDELNGKKESSDEGADNSKTDANTNSIGKITDRHEPALLSLIAAEAKVNVEDIQDFELLLYDTQPSVIGGLKDEFIFSPRLDNLCSSYTATQGLLESLSKPDALDNEEGIRMISLFDHEEVGSASAQGADSNLLVAVITRLASLKLDSNVEPTASSPFETFSKSFLISADMAHGVHPNYGSKHEDNHRPKLNKGPTIKINANQRYATNSPGVLLVQNAANLAKIPLQLFVVRNDSPCGSTIGPILASKLGMRTLDIGNPQLSMHSVRETCGSKDVGYAVELFREFFNNYVSLEKQIVIEDTEL
ncbi:Ape4p [Sugiyamaella lignohabitans]|uniref:aspartyl aminopeptidase n=1 Tax=Sugiyamaella lignohabitans TaxID=796027 RepID=A0A167CZS4_9ASCO|nr:Ape4p [Sugiyamaella lignohabitans]ANB12302.1 Ape4p [Sugiyamaella lignohabitans]